MLRGINKDVVAESYRQRFGCSKKAVAALRADNRENTKEEKKRNKEVMALIRRQPW